MIRRIYFILDAILDFVSNFFNRTKSTDLFLFLEFVFLRFLGFLKIDYLNFLEFLSHGYDQQKNIKENIYYFRC